MAYRWDRNTLFEFAKDSFRGFKERFKGQIDEVKKKKLEANERTNRWAGRRKEVSVHLFEREEISSQCRR